MEEHCPFCHSTVFTVKHIHDDFYNDIITHTMCCECDHCKKEFEIEKIFKLIDWHIDMVE